MSFKFNPFTKKMDVTDTAAAQSLQLISTSTATNQASVDITSGLSSSYKMMKVIGTGIQLVNAGGQALWLRCSTNGGSTFDTGNNYSYSEQYFGSDSSNDWNRSSADSHVLLVQPYGDSATSTNSNSFELDIFNISSTTLYTTFIATCTANNGAINYSIRVSGSYNVNSSVNALRFLGANGNIVKGNFSLYALS